MKSIFEKLADELKARIALNLQEIKKNEKIIRELQVFNDDPECIGLIEWRFSENRRILNENMDYVGIRIKLTKFIEKYKNSGLLSGQSKNETDDLIDFFDETVEGKLEFNEDHPCYGDEKFVLRLIDHYTKSEEYEKCHELIAIKNNK